MMILYPYGLRKALTLSYDDGVETDIDSSASSMNTVFSHLQPQQRLVCPRRPRFTCRHDLPPHE